MTRLGVLRQVAGMGGTGMRPGDKRLPLLKALQAEGLVRCKPQAHGASWWLVPQLTDAGVQLLTERGDRG